MPEIEDAREAVQIALDYTDEAFGFPSPTVEEVTKGDSSEWIVVISVSKISILGSDSVYTVYIDSDSGTIQRVVKKGTAPKVIDSLQGLLHSVKETVLSVVFLIREIKGKNP